MLLQLYWSYTNKKGSQIIMHGDCIKDLDVAKAYLKVICHEGPKPD
jgi:hypothetical protein